MENISRTKEEWIVYAQRNAYHLDWEKDIPKEFIDEELVSKVVYAHGAAIERIPKKYLTQKVWNSLATTIPDAPSMLEFMDAFSNNAETWGVHLSKYPADFINIPKQFQTQEVWNIAVSNNSEIVISIPERFQTQKMWIEFAKKCNREEIGYIPQKFYSNELFEILAERGRVQYIPKEYQNQEMWDKFVSEHHGYIEQVPKKYQTQEMWDNFIRENPSYMDKVPKKYQTQEMWRGCASRLYIQQIPMKYRDITEEEFNGLDEKLKTFLKTEKEYFEKVKLDCDAIKEVPEEFQNYDMWQIYIKNNPDNVGMVPEEYQTQEMWVEFVKRNPRETLFIPRRFYNQEIFDIYAAREVEGVFLIPREFQTQDMWNNFVKAKPEEIFDVPEIFQTKEMWNNYGNIFLIPKKFRTEMIWKKIIEQYPYDYELMPTQFLTTDIVEDVAEKGRIDDFRKIPKSLWTTKFLESYFSNASDRDVIFHIEGQNVPQSLLTQSICDRYMKANNYYYSSLMHIPAQFQSKDMWFEILQRNYYENVLLDMPIEFQTQNMWNKAVLDFNYGESDLKKVPSKFVEGVKKVLQKEGKLSEEIPSQEQDLKTDISEKEFEERVKVFKKFVSDEIIPLIVEIAAKNKKIDKLNLGVFSEKYKRKLVDISIKCKFISVINYRNFVKNGTDKPMIEELGKWKQDFEMFIKEQEKLIEMYSTKTQDKQVEEGNQLIVEDVKSESEIVLDVNKTEPVTKQQTLRQKFDINNEDDFDNLLAYYSQANKEYYSGDGKKKSEEEIKKRKNMNAQFKRILKNKAKQMPQNEDGEEFSATITSIEKGEVFNYSELKEVAENKGATLRLFNIMASGVYEKDGKKIRLTQKQRIALASTLEIVAGMRLDMDKKKKNNKTAPTRAQGKNDIALGDA